MATHFCPIRRHADTIPEAPALIWAEGVLSYQQLENIIGQIEIRLIAEGIKEGDRVGILGINRWEYIVLLQALFRLGALAIPLSTRFTDHTLQQLCGEVSCELLIQETAEPRSFIATRNIDRLFAGLTAALPSESTAATYRDDQLATVLFSSGSTGLPKAILHRWSSHFQSAVGSNENIQLSLGDRWLLSLPLYHVAGVAILFRCFVAGAAVVIPDPEASILANVEEMSITHVSMVSTQLVRMLDEKGNRPAGIKAMLLGGSAISRALVSRAFDAGFPIFTSYGMTELASQVTTTPAAPALDDLFTSGKLLSHRELKIAEDGQILVRGATRLEGYLEKTGLRKPFDKDGWFATGDIGRIDEKGRLVVTGRKDNMFISGGENIHPEEIERALESFAGVNRAFVVPVADQEFGQRPVAFLEVEKSLPTPDILEEHLRDRIPRFMNPVRYFTLDDQATGEGMKVSRKNLILRAQALLGL